MMYRQSERFKLATFALEFNHSCGYNPACNKMEAQQAADLKTILGEIAAESSMPKRIESVSARFLGRPYLENALDLLQGSETLRVSLEAFDCVTYVETVLAIALSGSVEQFLNRLRQIRYKDGQVSWARRNHYMIEWARNNEDRGLLSDLTTGAPSVEKIRTLSYLRDLPARTVTFRCFPKRALSGVVNRVEPGDLILFVSTKRSLDVFHAGLLFRPDPQVNADERHPQIDAEERRILLRHASRSEGGVVEQNLGDFMHANRMSGFVLLRPTQHRIS